MIGFKRIDKEPILRVCIKCGCCIALFIIVISNFFNNGIERYYSYYDYIAENSNFDNIENQFTFESRISQGFISKGNILNNFSIYLDDICDRNILTIEIYNKNRSKIYEKLINTDELDAGTWNQIHIDLRALRKGEEYFISLYTVDADLKTLLVEESIDRNIFTTCYIGNTQVESSVALQLQFCYRYMTFDNMALLFVNVLFIAWLVIILFWTIFKFELIYNKFYTSEKKQGILYAIYFSVSLTLLFNPVNSVRTNVTEFKRIIGNGLVSNYDCEKTISNFTHWFLYMAIFFSLFYMIANYYKTLKKNQNLLIVDTYLDKIVVIANVVLGFRCITYFYDESVSDTVFYYSNYLLFLLTLLLLAYSMLGLDNQISGENYLKILLLGFVVSIPVSIMVSGEWGAGKLLIGVQTIIFCVLLMVLKLAGSRIKDYIGYKACESVLMGGMLVFSAFPFVTSFYIELVNVLNQYSVFIKEPKKYYCVVATVLITIWLIVSFILWKKNIELKRWKLWSYLWIIFGISCLSVQIPLEATYYADIFETANSSILLSDFFNFGVIPNVEHLGHHMMAHVWESLIYAFLNRDFAGAIFNPYFEYTLPLLAVMFFSLVNYVWDEDMALWVVLLFPFYDNWHFFGMGMLVCLAVVSYIKKNTYIRAFGVWITLVWCTLYRIDVGYAFGIACIISLAIYMIIKRNVNALKKSIFSLVMVGSFGIFVWCVLCIEKSINSWDRLKEFLGLFSANQNWAYATIGNNSNMVFSWGYLFMPFVVEIGLIYVIFSRKFREQIGIERWILLLMFGLSYFANFSRGLVRHSLHETNTQVVFWSAYIFLAILLSSLLKKEALFIPVFAILILCNTLFVKPGNFKGISIANNAFSKLGDFVETWTLDRVSKDTEVEQKTYWQEIYDEKTVVQRVKWDASLAETIKPYRVLMDLLLEDDETYLDFLYNTFVYSAIGRKDPVYIAQSPTMLSGEYTQECFIDQVKSDLDHIPIVIMPNNLSKHSSIDGILLNYKYYKVSEFIFKTYEPLCEYRDFSIWCVPERRAEMAQRLMETDVLSDLETEVTDGFIVCKNIVPLNCKIEDNPDEERTMVISATQKDPRIEELQRGIDLSAYTNCAVRISVDYESSVPGFMQMYYTTEKNEYYSEDKSLHVQVTNEGKADFTVPITENSRLRLDIPENSVVTIKSIKVALPVNMIEWGYDSTLHSYALDHLPRIWAEMDEKNAAGNTVMEEMKKENGLYVFDNAEITDKGKGNYLLINTEYLGMDRGGLVEPDDEYIGAFVKLGTYENGNFEEKFGYSFTIKEGKHKYLFRVSSDYYWHIDKINAVSIECGDKLYGTKMKILEGD